MWGTSTTQMCATPSIYPLRKTESSFCGIPQAPGSSAAACVRVKSQLGSGSSSQRIKHYWLDFISVVFFFLIVAKFNVSSTVEIHNQKCIKNVKFKRTTVVSKVIFCGNLSVWM